MFLMSTAVSTENLTYKDVEALSHKLEGDMLSVDTDTWSSDEEAGQGLGLVLYSNNQGTRSRDCISRTTEQVSE